MLLQTTTGAIRQRLRRYRLPYGHGSRQIRRGQWAQEVLVPLETAHALRRLRYARIAPRGPWTPAMYDAYFGDGRARDTTARVQICLLCGALKEPSAREAGQGGAAAPTEG